MYWIGWYRLIKIPNIPNGSLCRPFKRTVFDIKYYYYLDWMGFKETDDSIQINAENYVFINIIHFRTFHKPQKKSYSAGLSPLLLSILLKFSKKKTLFFLEFLYCFPVFQFINIALTLKKIYLSNPLHLY